MIFRSGRSVLTTILTAALILLSAGLIHAQTLPAFSVQIEKDEGQTGVGALQGQVTEVDIDLTQHGAPLSQFRMVVSYPKTILDFQGLNLEGSVLIDECGWDRITAEVLDIEYTTGRCLRGFIAIEGIADLGMNDPEYDSCLATGNIFSLRFLLSNDRTLECQFAPVRFAFVDCTSNLLELRGGGLVWATDSTENPWPLDPYHECGADIVPDSQWEIFPTDVGFPQSCADAIARPSDGSLRLIDGGVDFICAGPIDLGGDLNLDGLAYTIADRVLYERYFQYGDTVFPTPTITNPYAFQAVIEASDVNRDSVSLTAADLVRMVRIIDGDEAAHWTFAPVEPTTISYQVSKDGRLYADQPIGGAYITLEGQAYFTIPGDNIAWRSHYRLEEDRTHVIMYAEQSGSPIEGVIITSNQPFRSVDLSEEDGGPTITVGGSLLPDDFILYQNYPNPFNPTTSIEFALPVRADYTLTIYNAQGQEVEVRQGRAEAGLTKLEWDGSDYASGVYFYKVEALGYEQTRKMLLVK